MRYKIVIERRIGIFNNLASITESSNSTVHPYFLKEEWKVKVEDSKQFIYRQKQNEKSIQKLMHFFYNP